MTEISIGAIRVNPRRYDFIWDGNNRFQNITLPRLKKTRTAIELNMLKRDAKQGKYAFLS